MLQDVRLTPQSPTSSLTQRGKPVEAKFDGKVEDFLSDGCPQDCVTSLHQMQSLFEDDRLEGIKKQLAKQAGKGIEIDFGFGAWTATMAGWDPEDTTVHLQKNDSGQAANYVDIDSDGYVSLHLKAPAEGGGLIHQTISGRNDNGTLTCLHEDIKQERF